MTKFTSYTIAFCVIACLLSASTLAAEPLSDVNEELINSYVQNDCASSGYADATRWRS